MYSISALIEKEGQYYVAHCLGLSVTSQGESIDESLENLREAVELYLKHADPEELERLKMINPRQSLVATISVG